MSATEIQTLLSQFDQFSNTYLRDEVEEALTRQAEITPHLLGILHEIVKNPLRYSMEGHNIHVYAALLLSHFREPSAHLPFIKAFSIAEEPLMDIWGDMTTETLPTLLYTTCEGSIEAIKGLIANREVDQYVRCAAMEALSYVVAFDPSRRDEVVDFFQGYFTGTEAAADSYFWGNLAATLCDLHPEESMPTLRKAFSEGIIRPGFIGLEDVEYAAKRSREESMAALQSWVKARMPVDVHAYISWFAEFHTEEATTLPFSMEAIHKEELHKQKNAGKNKGDKKAKKKK